jgi:hypothetical protein
MVVSAYENDRIQAGVKGFLTALEYAFVMEPRAYREITRSAWGYMPWINPEV